jgi:tetratricopeptide (TPR) repeat protein
MQVFRMKTRFLSRFTPSLMTADALEAIFVQRERLIREVLERIRSGVLSRTSQHALLIGPRGIGKTHFISLTYYRIRAMTDIQDRLMIAWLREEEWGITCFRDFLIRVLRSLTAQIADGASLERQIESVHNLPSAEAETSAVGILKRLVEHRTLILLVENLDDLFQRLGADGQGRLRHFMSENPVFSIIATSPSSFADLVRAGAPFGGFFQIHELEPLSFEYAVQLVSKIARYEGNDQLAAFISTPRGRARMRALRYLAGGNHRAYVIFSQLLAHERLEDLMEPLMRTIDDLTPYYHARIAALTSEQRKLIEYICDTRHPVRVAEVARACFLQNVTAGRVLEELHQMGFVHSLAIGPDAYFELREPLMRLSIEVKKHRGKPIRLLLDFLRLWYSPAELKQRLSLLPTEAVLEREYAAPALQVVEEAWKDPRITECCSTYNEAIKNRNYAGALKSAEELVMIRGNSQDLGAHAACLLHLGCFEEAAEAYGRVVAQAPEDREARRNHIRALLNAGRNEDAVAFCDRYLELDPNAALIWDDRATALLNLGRLDDCLGSCDRAIRLNVEDLLAWITRGQALADLGAYEDAAAAFQTVLTLDSGNALARAYLSGAFLELKRYEDGLAEARRAIALDPGDDVPWMLQGFALAGLNRNAEALDSFDKAMELGDESSLVQFKRAQLMLSLNRWRSGMACLNSALSRFAHGENPDAGNTAAFVRDLMNRLDDPEMLRLCIRALVLLYRKHRVLSPLAHGLIECIPDLELPALARDSAAHEWLVSWQEIAGTLPEFRIALRYLEFAVRYHMTRDMRLFMELPQEERAMLEPLLGIRVQATSFGTG